MTIRQQLRESRKQHRPLGAGSLADVRTDKPKSGFQASSSNKSRHEHAWLTGYTHSVCARCGFTLPLGEELPIKGFE